MHYLAYSSYLCSYIANLGFVLAIGDSPIRAVLYRRRGQESATAVINSNQHLGIEFNRTNLLCCCPFPSIAAKDKRKIQLTSNNKGSHV